MQHTAELCSNCTTETKCRRRDFSDQAWSVLVLWHEVQAKAVDQPLCDSCYDELREVLIDRADEIEAALAEPARKPQTGKVAAPIARPRGKVAAVKPQKVRKAG